MAYTVIGIFLDRQNAEDAINELQEKGFNAKDISIVMKDKEKGQQLAEDTGTNVATGAVTGLTTGAVIGGLAGLLGSFVIPGLGAFLIGGPIAATMGLTGAAAATVSGAATGAVAGGLLGALMGLGLPKEEAQEYEESINRGGILIAIPATDATFGEARDILNSYDATNVRTVSMPSDQTHRKEESEDEYTGDYTPRPSHQYSQPSSYASSGAKGGEVHKRTTRSSRKGRKESSRSSHKKS